MVTYKPVDRERIKSDAAYREDVRHRFLGDHFFAARVLGFDDFNERAHRKAVNLYFPKNPKLPMHAQHAKKKRLHLDPRGTFKTTLKRVDRIQWIAAFPEDVTILIESATQPLADKVAKLTGRAFWQPMGRPPTDFQVMFPELAMEKEPEGNWDTFNRRPSGAGDLDNTVAFTSPKSTQSGWHPFVKEPDDVEDSNNSGIGVNQDVRQGVIDKCDQNENLLRPGGFSNICGTRYHPFDYYGKCIELAEANPYNWEVLIRCSVTAKDGTRLVPGEFPAKEDLIFEFPETMLPYNELREKFHKNYESFMCQQQNDPQGGNIPTFDEKLYTSCEAEPERIPSYGGETFTCWRLPFRDKLELEGACARVIDGRVYVIDCWRGNYIPSRRAERMVAEHKKHQADAMMIIAVPGSEHMAAEIRNEAARRNVSLRIHWVEWEENEDRHRAEIQQLEPMMKVGRINFSTMMTKGQDCRKQFIHFGLVDEDGIIECVAKFSDLVPMSQLRANMLDEEIEWQRRTRDDAMLNSFLRQQNMPKVDEMAKQRVDSHLKAMSEVSHYRMPPLPGGLDG
jgi:hypothetical protein